MIDLHIHTNYSDGTWSLKETLIEAEKSGVNIISITDHDTVEAHKELKTIDYPKFYSGEIINGVELNTVFNKYKFELLGYDFDIDKINAWINKTYTKQEDIDLNKEFEVLVANCHKNNIKIDEDLTYTPSMGWPVDIVFASVTKYEENKKYFSEEEWTNPNTFFRSCTCNVDFPLYIDFSYLYPDATEVAKQIRNAGGKVFLAHLFFYPLKNHIEFLDMLREANVIDGVEVYHTLHTKEQFVILEEYCKKHNLLMCGGTDCHGDRKPKKCIGTGFGDMNINEDIIKNWHF